MDEIRKDIRHRLITANLSAMDALDGLLRGPAATHPTTLRMAMTDRWAIRIEDSSALTLVAVTEGVGVAGYDDGTEYELGVGCVALIRGTEPYTVSDRARSPVIAHIDEDGRCFDPTGRHSVAEQMSVGVRTWGNRRPQAASDSRDTTMLIATYRAGEISRQVVESLPRISVLDHPDDPLVALAEAEIVRTLPGQEVVIDRLVDLILITAIRDLMDRSDAPPAYFRASRDPVVGPAVALMHTNPGHPWTLAGIAQSVGVSRATLARRFTELMGEPPIGYLTRWRLALAADLLADPDISLRAIAHRVGYGSPFALSSAFTREFGMSPTRYAAHRSTTRDRLGETAMID